MKKLFAYSIVLLVTILFAAIPLHIRADSVAESEPNNSAAAADPLVSMDVLSGAVSPAGDADYFSIPGDNSAWGFIALLDTSGSSGSKTATLDALRADGTTVMQSDSGSWEYGSGIALQGYTDSSAIHYLRVSETGNDAPISGYTLRYYRTIITAQPEVEPNGTRATGTPSSYTMSGAISSVGDADCFAFQGRAGHSILLALDGDPEKDGIHPADLSLELIDTTNAILDTANFTGAGGKEFLEYPDLSVGGVYAYCVRTTSGTPGPTATYRVGILSGRNIYSPSYSTEVEWLNPPAGGTAEVGDTLTFQISITNESPVGIPGEILMYGEYHADCLDYSGAVPPVTGASSHDGFVSWEGQKTGLAAGETYSVGVSFLAEDACVDTFSGNVYVAYFFNGTGGQVHYQIGNLLFLPMVMKSP